MAEKLNHSFIEFGTNDDAASKQPLTSNLIDYHSENSV